MGGLTKLKSDWGTRSRFWGAALLRRTWGWRPRRIIPSAINASVQNAEPIMVTAASLAFLAHPLFFYIWGHLFPQPYENLALRLTASAFCLPVMFRRFWPARAARFFPLYWQLAIFFNVPFLFSFFLLQNSLSQIWMLSMIGGVFVLTFLVEFVSAIVLFLGGTTLSWFLSKAAGGQVGYPEYFQYLVIFLFPLVFGGIINYQLQRFRRLQHSFDQRLRKLTAQNAKILQEQNQLLSRFLSNTIVGRLRKFQRKFGLSRAITMITRQEPRYCGIMEADIRNFTKMLDSESEMEVAQQLHRCFTEIADVGQDLAVIKPVGDSIFIYTDDENGQDEAVEGILSLAVFFVHSVRSINQMRGRQGASLFNFGIALHAGEVVYGNLAGDTLIDPTIIGLHVNKTARLEEITKVPVINKLLGENAIILSEEIAWHGSNFIPRSELVTLRLDELNVTVRDFGNVKTVYAIPMHLTEKYYERALEHIRAKRRRVVPGGAGMEANSHQGVTYFYEMQGAGPTTTWVILIDVDGFPPRLVNQYALSALQGFEYNLDTASGQWLVVSTAPFPGEFDEDEIEGRIFGIIEGLAKARDRNPA